MLFGTAYCLFPLPHAVRQLPLAMRDEIRKRLRHPLIERRRLIAGEQSFRSGAAARIHVVLALRRPLLERAEIHELGCEEGLFEMVERVLGAEEMTARPDLADRRHRLLEILEGEPAGIAVPGF